MPENINTQEGTKESLGDTGNIGTNTLNEGSKDPLENNVSDIPNLDLSKMPKIDELPKEEEIKIDVIKYFDNKGMNTYTRNGNVEELLNSCAGFKEKIFAIIRDKLKDLEIEKFEFIEYSAWNFEDLLVIDFYTLVGFKEKGNDFVSFVVFINKKVRSLSYVFIFEEEEIFGREIIDSLQISNEVYDATKKWIQKLRKGKLRSDLGIPEGKSLYDVPISKIVEYANKSPANRKRVLTYITLSKLRGRSGGKERKFISSLKKRLNIKDEIEIIKDNNQKNLTLDILLRMSGKILKFIGYSEYSKYNDFNLSYLEYVVKLRLLFGINIGGKSYFLVNEDYAGDLGDIKLISDLGENIFNAFENFTFDYCKEYFSKVTKEDLNFSAGSTFDNNVAINVDILDEKYKKVFSYKNFDTRYGDVENVFSGIKGKVGLLLDTINDFQEGEFDFKIYMPFLNENNIEKIIKEYVQHVQSVVDSDGKIKKFKEDIETTLKNSRIIIYPYYYIEKIGEKYDKYPNLSYNLLESTVKYELNKKKERNTEIGEKNKRKERNTEIGEKNKRKEKDNKFETIMKFEEKFERSKAYNIFYSELFEKEPYQENKKFVIFYISFDIENSGLVENIKNNYFNTKLSCLKYAIGLDEKGKREYRVFGIFCMTGYKDLTAENFLRYLSDRIEVPELLEDNVIKKIVVKVIDMKDLIDISSMNVYAKNKEKKIKEIRKKVKNLDNILDNIKQDLIKEGGKEVEEFINDIKIRNTLIKIKFDIIDVIHKIFAEKENKKFVIFYISFDIENSGLVENIKNNYFNTKLFYGILLKYAIGLDEKGKREYRVFGIFCMTGYEDLTAENFLRYLSDRIEVPELLEDNVIKKIVVKVIDMKDLNDYYGENFLIDISSMNVYAKNKEEKIKEIRKKVENLDNIKQDLIKEGGKEVEEFINDIKIKNTLIKIKFYIIDVIHKIFEEKEKREVFVKFYNYFYQKLDEVDFGRKLAGGTGIFRKEKKGMLINEPGNIFDSDLKFEYVFSFLISVLLRYIEETYENVDFFKGTNIEILQKGTETLKPIKEYKEIIYQIFGKYIKENFYSIPHPTKYIGFCYEILSDIFSDDIVKLKVGLLNYIMNNEYFKGYIKETFLGKKLRSINQYIKNIAIKEEDIKWGKDISIKDIFRNIEEKVRYDNDETKGYYNIYKSICLMVVLKFFYTYFNERDEIEIKEVTNKVNEKGFLYKNEVEKCLKKCKKYIDVARNDKNIKLFKLAMLMIITEKNFNIFCSEFLLENGVDINKNMNYELNIGKIVNYKYELMKRGLDKYECAYEIIKKFFEMMNKKFVERIYRNIMEYFRSNKIDIKEEDYIEEYSDIGFVFRWKKENESEMELRFLGDKVEVYKGNKFEIKMRDVLRKRLEKNNLKDYEEQAVILKRDIGYLEEYISEEKERYYIEFKKFLYKVNNKIQVYVINEEIINYLKCLYVVDKDDILIGEKYIVIIPPIIEKDKVDTYKLIRKGELIFEGDMTIEEIGLVYKENIDNMSQDLKSQYIKTNQIPLEEEEIGKVFSYELKLIKEGRDFEEYLFIIKSIKSEVSSDIMSDIFLKMYDVYINNEKRDWLPEIGLKSEYYLEDINKNCPKLVKYKGEVGYYVIQKGILELYSEKDEVKDSCKICDSYDELIKYVTMQESYNDFSRGEIYIENGIENINKLRIKKKLYITYDWQNEKPFIMFSDDDIENYIYLFCYYVINFSNELNGQYDLYDRHNTIKNKLQSFYNKKNIKFDKYDKFSFEIFIFLLSLCDSVYIEIKKGDRNIKVIEIIDKNIDKDEKLKEENIKRFKDEVDSIILNYVKFNEESLIFKLNKCLMSEENKIEEIKDELEKLYNEVKEKIKEVFKIGRSSIYKFFEKLILMLGGNISKKVICYVCEDLISKEKKRYEYEYEEEYMSKIGREEKDRFQFINLNKNKNENENIEIEELDAEYEDKIIGSVRTEDLLSEYKEQIDKMRGKNFIDSIFEYMFDVYIREIGLNKYIYNKENFEKKLDNIDLGIKVIFPNNTNEKVEIAGENLEIKKLDGGVEYYVKSKDLREKVKTTYNDILFYKIKETLEFTEKNLMFYNLKSKAENEKSDELRKKDMRKIKKFIDFGVREWSQIYLTCMYLHIKEILKQQMSFKEKYNIIKRFATHPQIKKKIKYIEKNLDIGINMYDGYAEYLLWIRQQISNKIENSTIYDYVSILNQLYKDYGISGEEKLNVMFVVFYLQTKVIKSLIKKNRFEVAVNDETFERESFLEYFYYDLNEDRDKKFFNDFLKEDSVLSDIFGVIKNLIINLLKSEYGMKITDSIEMRNEIDTKYNCYYLITDSYVNECYRMLKEGEFDFAYKNIYVFDVDKESQKRRDVKGNKLIMICDSEKIYYQYKNFDNVKDLRKYLMKEIDLLKFNIIDKLDYDLYNYFEKMSKIDFNLVSVYKILDNYNSATYNFMYKYLDFKECLLYKKEKSLILRSEI